MVTYCYGYLCVSSLESDCFYWCRTQACFVRGMMTSSTIFKTKTTGARQKWNWQDAGCVCVCVYMVSTFQQKYSFIARLCA